MCSRINLRAGGRTDLVQTLDCIIYRIVYESKVREGEEGEPLLIDHSAMLFCSLLPLQLSPNLLLDILTDVSILSGYLG